MVKTLSMFGPKTPIWVPFFSHFGFKRYEQVHNL